MRRYFALIAVVAVTVLANAQTRVARPAAKKVAQGASAGAIHVPTKATVESFLRHVFGWDKEVGWSIASLGPSPAPDLSLVTVDLKTPQKSATQKLFITTDEKHVIHGEMFPFAGPPAPAKPSDTAINDFVRQMTGGNPAITWAVAEVKPDALAGLTRIIVVVTGPQGRGAQAFWVTRDGAHALVGEVGPFGADPYAADRLKLARGINGPVRGPANAPVTVVEFADLQCPACKAAAPIIDRLMSDEPNMKFVFQQFPLTQIHDWAMKAATFGDCVARESNPAFWKFVHDVYADQEQVHKDNAEQKLTAAATAAGVDGQKTAACAALPATATRINHSIELGKEMEVTGTPTLFVGGRKISNLGGIPYESLKKIVDFMATPEGK